HGHSLPHRRHRGQRLGGRGGALRRLRAVGRRPGGARQARFSATVNTSVWSAFALSVKVAGCATVITLVLGVAVGYWLARKRFPGRDLLDTLLTLPMVLPPTVLGYYLLVLLGRRGWLGGWLHETFGINLIFTWQGAVIAASVVTF